MVLTNIKDSSNTLLKKMSMKLVQRVGLIFLKPRLASWRSVLIINYVYLNTSSHNKIYFLTSLWKKNILKNSPCIESLNNVLSIRYQRGSRSLAENLSSTPVSKETAVAMDTDDDEEYDIPDEIEDIIGKN